MGFFRSIYKVHMDRDELIGMVNAMDAWRAVGIESSSAPSAITPVLSTARDRLFVFSGDASVMFTYDLTNDRWLPRAIRLPSGCRPRGIPGSPDGRWRHTIGYTSDTITRVNVETGEVQLIGPLTGPVSVLHNILNAASYEANALSPGQIVVIADEDVGPPILAASQPNAEGKLPSELAETRVLFDGIPAPLLYVYANKICAIVPYGIAISSRVKIEVECRGERTSPVLISVADARPGIFVLDSSGKGHAAMLNEDGTVNSAGNAASKGSAVVFYATGEGETKPPGVDGKIATDVLPGPVLPVFVWIGGREAEVLYAGAAPGMVAGLMQVNVRVPSDAPSGENVPVTLRVGDAYSQSDVSMAVR
jgi:uncharacterized protein (TIGR03437 family)